jgi:hypothetical protein
VAEGQDVSIRIEPMSDADGPAVLDIYGQGIAAGVWTLIAGIQAENVASLGLHEAVGFRRIGVQERIGRDRDGVWRDVVLMERRSPLARASFRRGDSTDLPPERSAGQPPS